jgi:hypothetical protein
VKDKKCPMSQRLVPLGRARTVQTHHDCEGNDRERESSFPVPSNQPWDNLGFSMHFMHCSCTACDTFAMRATHCGPCTTRRNTLRQAAGTLRTRGRRPLCARCKPSTSDRHRQGPRLAFPAKGVPCHRSPGQHDAKEPFGDSLMREVAPAPSVPLLTAEAMDQNTDRGPPGRRPVSFNDLACPPSPCQHL